VAREAREDFVLEADEQLNDEETAETASAADACSNYLSVKNVSSTFPFSPIKHRNVRRVSFLPFSR
jgi:hypothetical protein